MLRRSIVCRSGHGDLFPTSKAAAHLTPEWVMSRPTPLPPGKGKRYASFTTPEVYGKYQMVKPEYHEVKAVPVHHPAPHDIQHCDVRPFSSQSIAATVAGVSSELGHQRKTNENPVAQSNIAAQAAAEQRMKTRDYMEHKRSPMKRNPRFELKIAYPESQNYIEDRVNRLRKIENSNPNGYQKEWMPWEEKPPAPAPAPPKK